MAKDNFTFSTLKYTRPDFKKTADFLRSQTAKLKAAKTYEEAKAINDEVNAYTAIESENCTLVQIRNTLDTTDEFYETELEYIQNESPQTAQPNVEYNQALYNSPFKPMFEKEYGAQLFRQIELQKKSFSEKNVPLMPKESALETEYQKIMATAKINFDGKTLNLYGIQKYFENPDREIRKAAFKAWADFYSQNETKLEEIWSELIKIRNEMAKNLGFENFIPLGYMQQSRTDYNAEDVASFREQVRKELVPICEKLYKAQAKRIGVDEILAYDEKFLFRSGNAVPKGDDDFMINEARKMYHDMSEETGEFIEFMINHELMDLKNTPNKASTGYMTYLVPHLAPYVFSCFNHTIFDMQVLTHELGHAFAGYMAMRNQPLPDYYSESTDIAEIHSMSMEQFAYPYAENFFGADADKYRFAHLQEAITFVPFGVAVDEFQHIMYSHPELTPKERTYEWHKLEEKYMPWRKYGGESEFMERGGYWYYKLHIFLYPFYYINYTLTTMGAMEFKKKYALNKEEAWKDYLNLCKVGGSKSYLETLKYANLAIPFDKGSVKKSVSYAVEILEKDLDKTFE